MVDARGRPLEAVVLLVAADADASGATHVQARAVDGAFVMAGLGAGRYRAQAQAYDARTGLTPRLPPRDVVVPERGVVHVVLQAARGAGVRVDARAAGTGGRLSLLLVPSDVPLPTDPGAAADFWAVALQPQEVSDGQPLWADVPAGDYTLLATRLPDAHGSHRVELSRQRVTVPAAGALTVQLQQDCGAPGRHGARPLLCRGSRAWQTGQLGSWSLLHQGGPLTTTDLVRLAAQGESATLELKRSTGELREAMQALCAFANGKGGQVLIGARPDGELVGQQIREQTLHELSAARERYEALLLERAHSRRRWENQPADELGLKDLDRDEVFRIVRIIQSVGRLAGPVGKSVPDVLDRLGLRKDGRLLRAAVVLFGRTFLPDYPQCELRMARFRGVDKTEFLDQRQLRGPAFRLLEEAELFCQRHFPMPGKVVPGQMRRVETPLIPPDAMREILVNAFIHRDDTIAGGAVSLALFDDRVEVWSAGRFPSGITPEALPRPHLSVQRNPLIADVFHRAGLIEKWGRGTNRVAEMCASAGIALPTFAERSPAPRW